MTNVHPASLRWGSFGQLSRLNIMALNDFSQELQEPAVTEIGEVGPPSRSGLLVAKITYYGIQRACPHQSGPAGQGLPPACSEVSRSHPQFWSLAGGLIFLTTSQHFVSTRSKTTPASTQHNRFQSCPPPPVTKLDDVERFVFVHEVQWDTVTVDHSTVSDIQIACVTVAAYG